MAIKTVGVGEYVYEARHNWGDIEDGYEFGELSGVAVDAKDRLYVFHRGDASVNARIHFAEPLPKVAIFEPDGAFVGGWGDDFVVDPHHLAIAPDGFVYLVDRDSHEVVKCTPAGEPILRLGKRDEPSLQAPFNHPTSVAVSHSGDIYVADGYGNSSVHKFAGDGSHLLSWGSPGTGPGEFWVPHGIAVDDEGRVFVADRENNRVQVFDGAGGYLTEWRDLFLPTDVAVRDGVAYVCELLTTRFTVINIDTDEVLGRGRSEDQTHAICVDSQGNLYGAQVLARNVLKYERRGAS